MLVHKFSTIHQVSSVFSVNKKLYGEFLKVSSYVVKSLYASTTDYTLRNSLKNKVGQESSTSQSLFINAIISQSNPPEV